jgi:predicted GTPase
LACDSQGTAGAEEANAAVLASVELHRLLLAPDALPKAYLHYLANSLRDAFGLPIRFKLRKGDNPFSRD